jgi:hypothetical protein
VVGEAPAQAACRVRASELGGSLWRNNNGAHQDKRGRWVRYGLGNESTQLLARWKPSDLIGIAPGGRFWAVEMKHPGWAPRTLDEHELAQALFHQNVRALGGIGGFATCPEDLEVMLRRGW